MNFNSLEIINILRNRQELKFQDMKISYMIFKPNAEKHYKEMLEQIEENNFELVAQYAIFDYDTVNMALHQEQPEAMKYIIPISRMYKDFYGNYAILIIIGKRNITYENFCIQVSSLKRMLRSKYDLPYIAYAFNTALIGQENEHQHIIITDRNGVNIPQGRFEEEGTYMLFLNNAIHSPDEKIESLDKEMKLLYDMGIIDDKLILPKPVINNISRYRTFEFLKDLL